MSTTRRILAYTSALMSGLLLAGLGFLFAAIGLDNADKLGSVLGAFSGILGLVIAGISLTQAQTIRRETRAAGSEQILALARAIRPTSVIPVQAKDSLPADIADFVNREDVLNRIERHSEQVSPNFSAVCTVSGMAGVGKTALAVRAAHNLAHAYPDGKFFLNLHAYSADRAPVPPERALEALLRAHGLTAEQIPNSLEERIALWRSETANAQYLLLLDNAIGPEQVLPIIPAGPCLTIITSRRRLILDGGRNFSLSALATQEAIQLLAQAMGGDQLGGTTDELRSIVSHCGRLPLAIRLVARHFERHPAWTPENLLAELTSDRNRHEGLVTGQGEVMTAFQLSYEGLDPEQQRLLRRLALHPSYDLGVYAAAVLDGTNVAEVIAGLDVLTDQNLLEEPAYRRYQLHDLLREYALHRAQDDTAADIQAARGRLIDYYTFMALQAERLINLLGFRNLQGAIEWQPNDTPSLSSHAEAISWLETERPNLHACVELAVEMGQFARATRLARALLYFLRLKGYWTDATDLCQRATQWCEELDDQICMADMKFHAGDIARLTGRHSEAQSFYRVALTIYQELGDQHYEARALHSLGDLERIRHRYETATDIYTQALSVYQDTGNHLAEARALHSIADTHRLAGRTQEALEIYQTILVTYRDLRDSVGKARVLHSIADIHALDERGQALSSFQEALATYRELGDRLGEADALYSLGTAYSRSGQNAEELRHFNEALEVYKSLGDRHQEARTLAALAEAHATAGREEQVIANYQAATVASREVEDRNLEAEVERAWGQTLLSVGRREEAIDHLRVALALLESLGSPLVEDVQVDLDRATRSDS
ncbi:tetratricopeptide repeat protein [Actinomadura sp. 6K520]|uniref:ATP-binding protein n=1 Tax=Actinomadura sp. 6K520 TaxID=2530364 RepID=UPI00104F2DDC|nr:tetratricopeptide repeat protein [Actinomadura sp. 6K520]TDE18862.1 tetratricopeptide repeat protein [Actinomadura sp. 6K520]